ncbi:MAG: B12-binding domain-containing radical SAM protein, partial [Anaerolineales bacterium]|nr:B12-binding domain-containing radical SAM protein [Anaerolineales bacterium]
MNTEQITNALNRILPTVEKPGRYTGGELNSVVKNWEAVPMRICLAFPDIYDIGTPNLGLAILYDLINQKPDLLAERAFSPWSDMEAAMRAAGLPLYSLETKHLVREFDIFALSIPYEQLYSNVLNLLDLAGLPLLAAERDPRRHPLVIAGGHSTYNPEPLADFIDAFVIGEG